MNEIFSTAVCNTDMVHHDLTMVHVVPYYMPIEVPYGLSYGVPYYHTLCHCGTMVNHGIPFYTMVHYGVTMVYHGNFFHGQSASLNLRGSLCKEGKEGRKRMDHHHHIIIITCYGATQLVLSSQHLTV